MHDPSTALSGPNSPRDKGLEATEAASSQCSMPAAALWQRSRSLHASGAFLNELPAVSIASGRPLDGRLGPAIEKKKQTHPESQDDSEALV